ncbi:hypothetical protein NBRC111894_2189 [Sporolactobacillus inulinus]|uniref:Uncharacterized protein n=1 Tax=Sporolactobacillus inulinus TaxID=2078 RepID=A0A4Y1ZC63_9BACL|nr:hypothetical protein NBRC111894_2189 [Sporolactobacillus inulinus]
MNRSPIKLNNKPSFIVLLKIQAGRSIANRVLNATMENRKNCFKSSRIRHGVNHDEHRSDEPAASR